MQLVWPRVSSRWQLCKFNKPSGLWSALATFPYSNFRLSRDWQFLLSNTGWWKKKYIKLVEDNSIMYLSSFRHPSQCDYFLRISRPYKNLISIFHSESKCKKNDTIAEELIFFNNECIFVIHILLSQYKNVHIFIVFIYSVGIHGTDIPFN